jgi:TRAP-type C4-dicarboxylate transport system permease small subunit
MSHNDAAVGHHLDLDHDPDANLFTIQLNWRRWWTILPEIVALACAALTPLLVSLTVLSRYTDWYHAFWADDIVKVLFLWLVFLGGAIAVKYEAHVRMAILSDRIERSGRVGHYWGEIIRLSPIAAGAILVVLGIGLVQISMRRELPSLEISAGYFMAIVPASGVLMIFYAARDFWLRHAASRSTRA